MTVDERRHDKIHRHLAFLEKVMGLKFDKPFWSLTDGVGRLVFVANQIVPSGEEPFPLHLESHVFHVGDFAP